MDKTKIKLVAFDLDGTLTQHKAPLEPKNRAVLDALGRKYRLLMVGAGMCHRIFAQMGQYPIDILGNYGMQYARFCEATGDLEMVENVVLPCDRESVEARTEAFRQKYGYTVFAGNSVEYHSSGCVTIPILGTRAKQEDKLRFDPDRSKRRAIFREVCELFSDYTVFVGGSSSFDMSPEPYNKLFALERYCKAQGIAKEEVVYVGDDYGPGGNDAPIYQAGYNFIPIDDYRKLPEMMEVLL